ncbi:hypothetical protein [Cupriavidus malaysiensis]|uniref:Uncharacterized protein n=1 Tax=Cupriavidus malaysiensis TaxID=367825 RepID=A0ABN4TX11_9BURK|nr:hypothetical protein [Cupriavidus malaysiensis]AOZ11094.1 hypothetical protein BKK80_34610 [Cupriavidus malaysiensis]
MTKYEKLDVLILRMIGDRPQSFSEIWSHEIADECTRIAEDDTKARRLSAWRAVDADRVLDRRLQALRKAGKIRHTGMGWVRERSQA